jgi:hypothetical protein
MRKNNDRLGLITLIVLAVSIPITLFILQGSNLDFRFMAFLSDEPQGVILSDIKNDSFKINWVTEKKLSGGVKIFDFNGNEYIVYGQEPTSYHSIQIDKATPSTQYQFVILSDGVEYSNQGNPYIIRTADFTPNDANNFLVYGQVFSQNGINFQQGGLVTLTLVDGNGVRSQLVANSLNAIGGYQLNLKNLMNEALSSKFMVQSEVDAIITIYLSDGSEPVQKRYTLNFSFNRQLPNIYLGDINIDIIPGIEG